MGGILSSSHQIFTDFCCSWFGTGLFAVSIHQWVSAKRLQAKTPLCSPHQKRNWFVLVFEFGNASGFSGREAAPEGELGAWQYTCTNQRNLYALQGLKVSSLQSWLEFPPANWIMKHIAMLPFNKVEWSFLLKRCCVWHIALHGLGASRLDGVPCLEGVVHSTLPTEPLVVWKLGGVPCLEGVV